MVNWNNKLEKREYNKNYYLQHKQKFIENAKNWQKNNKDKSRESYKKYSLKNREKILISKKRWKINNPKYRMNYYRLCKEKCPEKDKARSYVQNHKQRGDKCQNCNSNKNLNFHHTNYEKNEGITLCRECHIGVHNKQILF